jgi:hypothetical protein
MTEIPPLPDQRESLVRYRYTSGAFSVQQIRQVFRETLGIQVYVMYAIHIAWKKKKTVEDSQEDFILPRFL